MLVFCFHTLRDGWGYIRRERIFVDRYALTQYVWQTTQQQQRRFAAAAVVAAAVLPYEYMHESS